MNMSIAGSTPCNPISNMLGWILSLTTFDFAAVACSPYYTMLSASEPLTSIAAIWNAVLYPSWPIIGPVPLVSIFLYAVTMNWQN